MANTLQQRLKQNEKPPYIDVAPITADNAHMQQTLPPEEQVEKV